MLNKKYLPQNRIEGFIKWSVILAYQVLQLWLVLVVRDSFSGSVGIL